MNTENTQKSNAGKIWLGIGIGCLTGCAAGYAYGSYKSRKKVRRVLGPELKSLSGLDLNTRMQQICQEVYEEGHIDGWNKHEELVRKTTIFLDGNTLEEMTADLKGKLISQQVQKELEDEPAETDDIYASPGTLPTEKKAESDVKNPDSKELKEGEESKSPTPFSKIGSESEYNASSVFDPGESASDVKLDGERIYFRFPSGEEVSYPKNLFFDDKGQPLGEVRIRQNLRDFESDPKALNALWEIMGYGTYIPDPGIDPTDYDVSIDDNELSNLGDEPYVKTIEREKFMADIDRHLANPDEGPRLISKKEFDEEAYLEKDWWDYYDVDNVFTGNSDMDTPIDNAYEMVGVTNGNDLFGVATFDPDEDDNDPDIVHIKNFRMNTVLEITRRHKAYEAVKDGRVYFEDGGTSQV